MEFRAFKNEARGVQSLAREREFGIVARCPAFFAKIQVKTFVVSVKFVSDNAVSDVLRVGTDLMFPSRVKLYARECVSVPAIQRFEKCNGGLCVRTFAHALFDENGACGVRAQRRIDELWFAHFSFKNGKIGFGNPTSFDGFLAFACGFAVECDENDSAGLAIKARNKVHGFTAAPLAHGSDEARPRSVF